MVALTFVTLPFFCAAFALALWQGASFVAAPPSWRKSLVKTGAVAALAAGVAVVAPAGPAALILWGLVAGSAGDFALSRPGQAAFLSGMAAFALGHLAYAAAFFALGTGGPALYPAVTATALALCALLCIAPRAGALGWPVRAYIGVIWVMVIAALRVPDLRLVTGAALFMTSDFLLALELFVLPEGRTRRLAAFAVWALYWPAQALIALAALG
ncbi:lysoplasmalogenase family protein [Rhodobacter maris]|uniref:Uncharacterized membrane protein YhhN n=1 Tax=Rhodobacter maris TaxID=446682 RepID=A0A285SM53_9RHOB|nr:lysoplasmalogenase family protein [Rhodobacter maris]SOC08803.1 uncharacterized membrane protein YhhN [Rhodobacter maris]